MSIITFCNSKNASIFNLNILSGKKTRKVNQVGTYWGKNKIHSTLNRKTIKILRKNGNLYAKTVFDKIDFLIFFVIQKQITVIP